MRGIRSSGHGEPAEGPTDKLTWFVWGSAGSPEALTGVTLSPAWPAPAVPSFSSSATVLAKAGTSGLSAVEGRRRCRDEDEHPPSRQMRLVVRTLRRSRPRGNGMTKSTKVAVQRLCADPSQMASCCFGLWSQERRPCRPDVRHGVSY